LLRPGSLSVVFQPVFEISAGGHRLHSLECLTRGPEGTNVASASVLFEYVRRKGHEQVLDLLCIENALRAASLLKETVHLSVNVHASTLERNKEFPAFLKRAANNHGIALSRLTIEIVEHAPVWSGPGFLGALALLRETGARIALDDIGLGQSNYRMMLDCHPDYFKVDCYLVQGCHKDFRRQAILDSLVQLARKFGSQVIAEGVEDVADLHTVDLLEVELVQGFLLSRPLAGRDLGCLIEAHA
jgi:EAL domain-containing protein (putative c-di-GMP-specific phosphodiesterase class I)